ncbi:MAG: ATP-binding protein [Pseudomonadota bacterium]
MKRAAVSYLQKWYKKQDRVPLIIRGARQVGKSTLVRLFCQEQKIRLIEVNLEIIKLKSLTQEQLSIQEILDEIQYRTKEKYTPDALLFFDEIQETPRLISFLRYFYEQRPDIAIIAAGSLLEFAIKKEDFSFPVGRVEFYHLGPMLFSEFLIASGEDLLAEKILHPRPSDRHSYHNDILKYLKKYFYVGGMPKAVVTYLESRSYHETRGIQDQILQTFVADFPKYRKRIDYSRIDRIFKTCPAQLGKKIIYQNFDRESKAREIRMGLELLMDAKILLPCYHSEASTPPLAAGLDYSLFKVFFLDIGLLNASFGLEWDLLESAFEQGLSTKGIIAEQFAAQHLNNFDGPQLSPSLVYWLKDKGAEKAEVDFLVQSRGQILPVEVKAGKGDHNKSLFYYSQKKNCASAIKLSLLPFSSATKGHIIDGKNITMKFWEIPIYYAESLKSLLASVQL